MIKKKINIIVLSSISFVLIVFSLFLFIKYPTTNKESPIIVELRNNEGYKQIINTYEEDDKYYIFLPSYSNENNTIFKVSKNVELFKDESNVTNSIFLNEGQYNIDICGNIKQLIVLKSANIATIYIDTKKNALDRINNNKEAKEKVSITLYEEDGSVDYINNKYEDKISGRGNSTWDQDKKPFNIYLKKESKLLGMKESNKWALLANAYDSSNIRDLLYKKIAVESGLDYTPYSEYVDLYINGNYNGLYELSEKINFEDNNLSSDYFLCTFEYWQRSRKLENLIRTDICDVAISIEYLNDIEKKDFAVSKIQSMENAIVSEESIDSVNDEHLCNIIDIDSWVKGYLIDEITKNLDSNIASSYFYLNDDGKIYKGPVWDGDRTLGSDFRNNNPNGFFATRIWRGSENYNQYYSLLMKKDFFRDRTLQIYNETFVPIIEDLTNDYIDKLSEKLLKSSNMNKIRWSKMFSYLINYQNQEYVTCDDIKEYLINRKTFLDDNLKNIKDFCTVYIKLENGSYYIDNVLKGEKYIIPNYSQFDYLNSKELIDENTGNNINLNMKIYNDVRISTKQEETINEENIIKKIMSNSKMITGVSTFVILIGLLITAIIIDRKNNI